jgi:hypothetical protein
VYHEAELPEGDLLKAPRESITSGAFFPFLSATSLTGGKNPIYVRLLIVHGEGRKMRWILIEEDISIWKLLFIMGFLALLVFALVQTAPSAEIQLVRG